MALSERVEIVLETKDKSEPWSIDVDGMFLAIGHVPVTEFLVGQLDLNEHNYVISSDGVHTEKEGVFVAGDVEDYIYRQAITASGAGCRAALEAQKWIESR